MSVQIRRTGTNHYEVVKNGRVLRSGTKLACEIFAAGAGFDIIKKREGVYWLKDGRDFVMRADFKWCLARQQLGDKLTTFQMKDLKGRVTFALMGLHGEVATHVSLDSERRAQRAMKLYERGDMTCDECGVYSDDYLKTGTCPHCDDLFGSSAI